MAKDKSSKRKKKDKQRSRKREARAANLAAEAAKPGALLQRFFDAGVVGMAIASPDHRFLQVNNTFCSIVGYPREELIGMKLSELCYSDDRQLDADNLEGIALGEIEGFCIEKRYVRQDGLLVNGSSSCWCARGKDGAVDGIVVVVEDISRRKRDEENLRLFENIVNTSSDVMAFIGTDYVYRSINNRYAQALNRPREKIIGMTVAELLGADYFNNVIKSNLDACLSGQHVTTSSWFDLPGLGRRYMTVDYKPHLDKSGRSSGAVVTLHDITQYKLAEDNLLRYERIVNSVSDYMAFIDANYVYLALNQQYLSAFELSREQAIGRSISEVVGEEGFKRSKPLIDQALSGKEACTQIWTRHKGLGRIFLDTRYIPYRDANGEIAGVIAVSRNITRQVLSEQNLQLYEHIVNASSDLIAFVDSDGIYRAANDRYLNAFHTTREQLIGQRHSECLGENPIDFAQDGIMQKCLAGDNQSLENWYDLPGLGRRYLNTKLDPHRNEGGAISGAVISIRDVTQHKLAEEALRAYEHIVNNVSDYMAFIDHNYVYLAINKSHLEAFNATHEKIIGHTVEELVGKENFETIAKPNIDRAFTGEECSLEAWSEQPGRGRRFVALHFAPYRDEYGVIKGVIVTGGDITEKKEHEEMLLRYDYIVNASSDYMAIVDTDYRYLAINEQYLGAFQKTRDEVIGHQMCDVIGLENFENISKPLFAHCLAGEVATLEGWSYQPAYGNRYLRFRYAPYNAEDGTIRGAIISAHDMTDYKRAQNTLELYEHIVNASTDYIAIVDQHFRYMAVNQAYLECFSVNREETIGNRLQDVIGADNFETIAKPNIERCLRGESFRNQTWSYQPAFGRVYLDIIYKPYRAVDGETVGVIINAHDITDLKEAQDSLAKSERQLRKAQRIAHLGFWDWDIINDQVFRSDEANKILGYPDCAATYGDMQAEAERIFHPDDFARVRAAIQASLNEDAAYSIVHRVVLPAGEIRHVHVQGELTRDNQSKPVRMFGTIMDITELKRVEAELERHRDNLEELVKERTQALETAQQEILCRERLATLGQLTATVSHELRNPLAAMMPALFVLRNRVKSEDARVHDQFACIERNIERCDRIIDELLDFTRISDLSLKATPIHDWLSQVLDEQEIPTDIRVRRDFDLADLIVRIDADRLRRALINVFDNACQSMVLDDDQHRHIKDATVTISAGLTSERLELVVTDCGPGIADEVLPKIFEPLYSTKSFGVGLGLPTVKQIMEQHYGGIEIRTVAGGGTHSVLWLPRKLVDEEVAA
jgi:PAS domain S-box-containing protein